MNTPGNGNCIHRKESSTPDNSRVANYAFLFVVGLYVAWIGAWILERFLENELGLLSSEGARFFYWLAMKLLLWIAPSIILIRFSGRSLRETIPLTRVRAAILWGGGAGLALGVIALAGKAIVHQPLFASSFGWAFFSGVFVSPVIEEVTFRGAVLGSLMKRHPFAAANTITALLFVGSHLPGWYFQGRFAAMMLTPVGGALSIFLIGWLFGLVAHKSGSLLGSTLTHVLNNLFSG